MARRENGQLHYIVNDHLGTPKEAFNEKGALVWSVDHDTWGTVRKAWMSSALDPVPDEKGEFLGESFDGRPVHTLRTSGNTALKASVKPNPLFIPIRFQGQYEDAETGLFYNFYRYYDPYVGSYFSRDPIGIVGGTRLNAYVDNPTQLVDSLGLAACCTAENAAEMFAKSRDMCGVELTPDQMREINNTLDRIRKGDRSQFARDGTPYQNSSTIDPESAILQSGNYTEWTVRMWSNQSQGGDFRIVVDANTGRRYFSPTHYRCFIEIGRNYR